MKGGHRHPRLLQPKKTRLSGRSVRGAIKVDPRFGLEITPPYADAQIETAGSLVAAQNVSAAALLSPRMLFEDLQRIAERSSVREQNSRPAEHARCPYMC